MTRFVLLVTMVAVTVGAVACSSHDRDSAAFQGDPCPSPDRNHPHAQWIAVESGKTGITLNPKGELGAFREQRWCVYNATADTVSFNTNDTNSSGEYLFSKTPTSSTGQVIEASIPAYGHITLYVSKNVDKDDKFDEENLVTKVVAADGGGAHIVAAASFVIVEPPLGFPIANAADAAQQTQNPEPGK